MEIADTNCDFVTEQHVWRPTGRTAAGGEAFRAIRTGLGVPKIAPNFVDSTNGKRVFRALALRAPARKNQAPCGTVSSAVVRKEINNFLF